MKKLTKLLLPSVAIMLVAVMALTGATYAWFQSSPIAYVEEFGADVVQANGLSVSWDGSHWVSTLRFADPTYLTGPNGNTDFTNANVDGAGTPWEFKPVSTHPNAFVDGNLNMYSADFEDGVIKGITKATDGYIKYDIFVKLDTDSTVLVKNLTVDGADPMAIGLASRVAIVYHGTKTNYNLTGAGSFTTQYASALDSSNFILYEPHSTVHTEEGQRNQAQIDAAYSGAITYPYVGLFGTTTPGTAVNYNLGDKNAVMDTVTGVTTDNSNLSFEMKAGYSRLSVYVWVEGQDADCLNDLSGSGLNVSFSLEKVIEGE